VTPIPYGEVLARNLRAARVRGGLTQEALAARMRALGFSAWRFQVVGNVEKNARRVTAEEIHGLAWALGSTIPALMSPADEDRQIVLPGGQVLSVRSVQLLAGRGTNDMTVMFPSDGGTEPMFTHGAMVRDASGRTLSTEDMLAQRWPGEPRDSGGTP
jgi:transcriptional regulator with XRE-family HTH domain